MDLKDPVQMSRLSDKSGVAGGKLGLSSYSLRKRGQRYALVVSEDDFPVGPAVL